MGKARAVGSACRPGVQETVSLSVIEARPRGEPLLVKNSSQRAHREKKKANAAAWHDQCQFPFLQRQQETRA